MRYLRLTIDVAVFDDEYSDARRVTSKLLNDGNGRTITPSEDGKTIVRRQMHTLGTGEQLAREFMAAVNRGGIEIDDIRDVEDHSL